MRWTKVLNSSTVKDRGYIYSVLDNTSSHGVIINDFMMYGGIHGAPSDGVGVPEIGYSHGKYGSLAFTHLRIVVTPPLELEEALAFRYPP